MKRADDHSRDEGLLSLMRLARPAPSLPPRFQEGVWRRVERGETEPGLAAVWWAWVDGLAAAILRPRVLVSGFTAVLLCGLLVGMITGAARSRDMARAAYVASVAPNALH